MPTAGSITFHIPDDTLLILCALSFFFFYLLIMNFFYLVLYCIYFNEYHSLFSLVIVNVAG